MADIGYPLDVQAAEAAVRAVDEVRLATAVGAPVDAIALFQLHEELIGHLLLLLAEVQELYRDQPGRAWMGQVVEGAVRLAGGLAARPGIGHLDEVLVVAGVCKLLLVLHQIHPQATPTSEAVS
ncbi:hypothetical protein ACFRAR_11095 [Kitasatospora sp. NPDC056651]|uniref:hypothetical protein n=1 Tax=Kitasatospora sp. NPDC056651 TaxID=3345892 RepID=UPI0036CAB6BE